MAGSGTVAWTVTWPPTVELSIKFRFESSRSKSDISTALDPAAMALK